MKDRRKYNKLIRNSFCPTGTGGGVDPSCSPNSGSGVIKDKHGQEYKVTFDGDRTYDIGVPGVDVRGVTAGSATLKNDKSAVMSVHVQPEHRNKGLATALYSHIEKHLGRQLQPNWALTPDGEALWKSRRAKGLTSNARKRTTPTKFDPTRTTTLRRAFVGKIRRKFALLRKAIYDLLVTEDALGLKKNLTYNAFCPTGPGGGIDDSCGREGTITSGGHEFEEIPPQYAIVGYVAGGDTTLGSGGLEVARQQLIHGWKKFPKDAAKMKKQSRALLDEMSPGSDTVTLYHVSSSDLSKRSEFGEFRSMTSSLKSAQDLSKEIDGASIYTAKVPKSSIGIVVDYNDVNISDLAYQKEVLNDKPIPINLFKKYDENTVHESLQSKKVTKSVPAYRKVRPGKVVMGAHQEFVEERIKSLVKEGMTDAGKVSRKLYKDHRASTSEEWVRQVIKGITTNAVWVSKFEQRLTVNHIEKLSNGKYRLFSHDGKNLGTFESHDEAAKHEGEVEYFKHVSNERWRFNTTPEQLEAFKEWLKTQVDYYVTGMTDEELWRKFIESGFKKGAGRAFDDTKPQLGWTEAEGAFYAGTKDQFLKSAFGQPESLSKVQLLAARTFDELEGMSADTQNKLGRILVDGLTKGNGPISIAREMSNQLNLSMTRAETIARTELIRAHAEGQLAGMEELGVEEVGVMVEWSTAGDDRVCELCEPMEGVVLKIEEARGMIPRHPNCRCAFVPANVAEPTDDQKRGKRKIIHAVRTSAALGKDDFSTAVPVTKERPKSVLPVIANVFDPDEPRDDSGKWTTGESLADSKGELIKTEGGRIDIQHTTKFAPRKQSVIDFVVDEDKRGKGIGDKLLKKALSKYNDLGGQVSSAASLKVFHNNGFRNPDLPNGSFEEHLKLFKEEGGSLYMAHKDDNGRSYITSNKPKSVLPVITNINTPAPTVVYQFSQLLAGARK